MPVVCAATPGFIVPRIQALAMNEAARMVEEGVASAEEIDKAIRYGFGFRYAVLGLLEFIDWGGGDILYYASRYLEGALGSDRYRAPDVISRNMQEGRIGLRTGSGFLDYSASTSTPIGQSGFRPWSTCSVTSTWLARPCSIAASRRHPEARLRERPRHHRVR